jgi:hypothetical protein
MAATRIKNPIGASDPVHTSITHDEFPHLIMGPYTTGTTLTLECCMLVNVSTAGLLAKHTTKIKPAGVIVYSREYDWGSTTPSMSAVLPDYIDVYICSFGPCLVQIDASDTGDTAYMGCAVYESAVGGLCAYGVSATDTDLDEAAHQPIGWIMDLLAQGAGTDGDLVEVFINLSPCAIST